MCMNVVMWVIQMCGYSSESKKTSCVVWWFLPTSSVITTSNNTNVVLKSVVVVLKNMVTVLHVDLVESFWWLWLFSLLQTGDTNEAQKWKDRTIKPCCCAIVLPLNVFVVNEVVFSAEKRVNEYLISNAKSSTYIQI